jgi:hypothetical protein
MVAKMNLKVNPVLEVSRTEEKRTELSANVLSPIYPMVVSHVPASPFSW